jgi:hypothetical protein
MTRHGMAQPAAAGGSPLVTDARAFSMTVVTDKLAMGRVLSWLTHEKVQRSRLSASIPALLCGRRADADIGRSSKSP